MNLRFSKSNPTNRLPWLVAIALLSVLQAGCGQRTPSNGQVLEALNAANPVPVRTFRNLRSETFRRDVDKVLVKFSADAELAEPLYVGILTQSYLTQEFQLDASAVAHALSAVQDPRGGQRLMELARTSPPTPDWNAITLVKQSSPKGIKETYTGEVLATRVVDRWSFSDWRISPSGAPAPGLLRSQFRGAVFAVDATADHRMLSETVQSWKEFARRIAAAEQELARIHAETRAKSLAAARAMLKPGTIWAGALEESTGNSSVPIYVEVIGGAGDPDRADVLLRNDGSWGDTRHAYVKADCDQDNNPTVVLSSAAAEARTDSGPIVSASQNLSIYFKIAGDILTAEGKGGILRLRCIANPAVIREPHEQAENQMRQSTQAGRYFQGLITPSRAGASKKVLLRFVRNEADGAVVEASLETIEVKEQWQLTGSVKTSKYARDGWPVKFSMPAKPSFRLQLKWAEGRLIGSSTDGYDYSLEPATPDFLNELQRARTANEERFLRASAPGRTFTGLCRITNPGGYFSAAVAGQILELRLRFTRQEDHGQIVEGRIESAQRPENSAVFQGTLDPFSGVMRLTFGQGKWRFTNGFNRFQLQVTPAGLSGSGRCSDGDVTFEFSPID